MISFQLRYGGTQLYFGPESGKFLGKHLSGVTSVLLVTSRTAAMKSGALSDMSSLLEQKGIRYQLFSEVTPNPTVDLVRSISERARETEAQVLIAIGGGSVIDAAKAAAVVSKEGGDVEDYLYHRRKAAASLPLLAVNLTHGTGTEIDRYAVITDEVARRKIGTSFAYPVASADDPRYLLTLPPDQTLYTGLDAFYHSYESATRLGANPLTITLALSAVQTLVKWLPVVLKDGNSMEGRYWVLYASMLAGIAIDLEGTHVIHAIEHGVSAYNPSVPHGAGLAILGPRSAYYTHAANPGASAQVLSMLDPSVRPSSEDASKAQEAVESFQRELGFRLRLSDFGFDEESSQAVAEDVINRKAYPSRELMPIGPSEIRDIVSSSIRGCEPRPLWLSLHRTSWAPSGSLVEGPEEGLKNGRARNQKNYQFKVEDDLSSSRKCESTLDLFRALVSGFPKFQPNSSAFDSLLERQVQALRRELPAGFSNTSSPLQAPWPPPAAEEASS